MNNTIMARLITAWTAVEQLTRGGHAVATVDLRDSRPTIWLDDGASCLLPAVRESTKDGTAMVAQFCGCRIKWRAD